MVAEGGAWAAGLVVRWCALAVISQAEFELFDVMWDRVPSCA